MSKNQEKLKKELLEQVSRDVQNAQDPQKEAFKLVQNANETFKQFESALKKPLDDEMLKQRGSSKKNVQFADTIKTSAEMDRPKSVENKKDEKPILQPLSKQNETKASQPERQSRASKKESKVDKPQQKMNPKQEKPIVVIPEKKPQPKENQESKKSNLQDLSQKPQPITFNQQQVQERERVIQNQKQVFSESESSSGYDESRREKGNHGHSCRKHSKEREIANRYEEIILKNQESAQQLQVQLNEQNIEKSKLITENIKLQSINDMLQQEIKNLNQQLSQSKRQIDQLDKQLYDLKQASRSELLIVKDQLQESKFQCAELENKNNYLNKAKDTFEQNLKQFESEVGRLQKINLQQTQVAAQDKLAILEKDGTIERLEKLNHQLSIDLNQINALYKEVNEKHKSLLAAYNSLENQKITIENDLEFRKKDQQENLSALKEKIQKLTNQKEIYDEEMGKMQQIVKDAKSERDQYKLQYEQMKVLCSESEELRKRLKLREVENEQLQCENDKLKWKVRKDPNGILSDLKIMKLQAEDPNAKVSMEQLSKLDNQVRQLQEENNRLSAENKQLLKQIQQTELYVQEVKSMFDRERSFLEEKVFNKEKEINEMIIRHRHEMAEIENKNQDFQRRLENENKARQTHQAYQQQSYSQYNPSSAVQQSASKVSPYSVPQLQAKIKSYI
ncbi:unnamed protein product (macronuclear) [Paramecium tetraurelia]|uniref:Uncharacterized protein n=1 Tax=Paramecium tetraurelia TaxID=5888 RepID=A0BT75_PARTE|nr:uncharacterized protein GSPATT00031974001 [Paramecium tetraurelia]CAK61742.1 unnamed protein product [Paramecium tetraurelia]|eukprot:XP_001429140.1 hypothetical protein (macronuclear) [Paramecium tetraurelia strain d4-2]